MGVVSILVINSNITSLPRVLSIKCLAPTHRHILETAITLLQTAHLPPKFWFHACATSIYLINRMPCQILQHNSPYFLLYGSPPVVHHL